MDPKNNIDRQGHWENVYSTKSEQEVSWFQDNPEPSLDLIAIAGGNRDSRIIDIGGGASRLVDTLLADGYKDITVLDLSAAGLEVAKKRLGPGAAKAAWVAADVTRWIPERTYDIWHDRAAFHFLSEPDDQAAYVERLRKALRQGGHAVIGTFAPDGPERSAVCRSSATMRRHSGNCWAIRLNWLKASVTTTKRRRAPFKNSNLAYFNAFADGRRQAFLQDTSDP